MMTILILAMTALSYPTQHPDARGATVMGFDQDKTAHHFYLYDDGGAIDIAVKDATDATDRDAIRSHLPHIVGMFSAGDFDAPMLVHDSTNVPGTATLSRLKDAIRYAYVETPSGGRVNIVTADKTALAALHQFLTYQIREHHTGDPVTVRARK
jgi:hypothetical protein